ncbi:Fe2+-dependent dioxygenase [Aliiroseovarius subalbicans]|uniref:Fe2+-dependent dioxygenase n=1 Tax=Aliiroseovarius subalbicans TaxID=2925840 RepID=UPI001F577EE1|nr:Fe2+-dependent dioxygenase [Aliiroseovarius subalbicans]MCI2400280.1 Fe2+-dependent dioxygenase [Aliiroseovarius subalbicans]
MPIVLKNLFKPGEIQAVRNAALALPFEDGKRTAGRIAKAVKDNAQAAASHDRDALLDMVERRLEADPTFQAAALPRAFAKLMLTRTGPGQHYGDHVDNALIAGQRADLSFTLFLSDPDSYQGGELVIVDRVEDRAFKLEPGQALLYPSTTLHRVNPVSDGTRLVVIGWITSWVRDPAQREVLFDLAHALSRAEAAGDSEQILTLSKTRTNLLRMWAS